ncbi:ppt1, partial [Symbiodinium sp. CCMP2456]
MSLPVHLRASGRCCFPLRPRRSTGPPPTKAVTCAWRPSWPPCRCTSRSRTQRPLRQRRRSLDAICRDILCLGREEEGPGVAVLLRRFFEHADRSGNNNGYLELDELLLALRTLPSCRGLGEEELEAVGKFVDLNGDKRINYAELLRALSVRHCNADPGRRGPKALLEDMLEAVHRVLHFDFAKPLRSLLRRLCPRGCTRCTPAKFRQALESLNGQEPPRLSTTQLSCL